MKILLRHAHSGHYIDAAGNLTTLVSEARNFAIASDAIKFCSDRDMKEMEMIMTFNNPPSELCVPVERASVSVGPIEL